MRILKYFLVILNLLAGYALTTAIMVSTHVNQIYYAAGTYGKLDEAHAIDWNQVASIFPDATHDPAPRLAMAVHFIEPRSTITKRGWPISAVFYANAIMIALFMGRKPKSNTPEAK
jgi:hypothetical protein